MTRVEINGLPLPSVLSEAIEAGRWSAPENDVLQRVFAEVPQGSHFYSLEYMRLENRRWPDVGTRIPMYLGEPDEASPPGDIEPSLSVLIGDLGYDMPFALDFRRSREEPRVIYFTLGTGRWITVAATMAGLLHALGLDER